MLQQGVRRVLSVRVLLDGLQEQRVSGDPLDRHHQEESQRRGVHLRPEERRGKREEMDIKDQFISISLVEYSMLIGQFGHSNLDYVQSYQSAERSPGNLTSAVDN